MNFVNTFQNTNARPAGKVELVEFGNPLCARSRGMRAAICTIMDHFKAYHLTYVYRHYPTLNDTESLLAAVAIEAAGRQGKFWPMYSALLDQPAIKCANLAALALTMDLDLQQFLHDLVDDHLYSLVKRDWQAGHLLGVRYSPTLFIDGQRFHGKLTQARLTPVIQFHLSQAGVIRL